MSSAELNRAKADAYAATQVAGYWIILAKESQLERYGNPIAFSVLPFDKISIHNSGALEHSILSTNNVGKYSGMISWHYSTV